MYEDADHIKQILDQANRIVVLQADNPDGDSLASALALEHILGDLGKSVYLYCGMDMPAHLRYLPGWDRVNKELPGQFDAAVIVDTSSDALLEILGNSGQKGWLKSKPLIIIDHHQTEATIDYARVMCIHEAVATGEVIYELANQLQWPLSLGAKTLLAISILSDSLGLMADATTSRSIQIIAELVEGGVKLSELDSQRRELMRKTPEILQYKARLIERIEYSPDGRVATITIPWEEIEQYSHEYNPSILVLDEMRLVTGVDAAIAFKVYKDGKMTAKIRCNYGKPIGKDLAEHFGGGGHPYASGFKITDGRPLNEVRSECIDFATELLDNLAKGNP